MSFLKIEHFRILFLNQKNVILADELLGVGTVNQAPVYSREVIKRILFHEASSVILIHNHPSEDPTPSKIDLLLTLKIIEACRSIDVRVLDHVIIGGMKYYSFDQMFNIKRNISSLKYAIKY